MSFQLVVDSEQHLTPMLHLLRTSLLESGYSRNPQQVFDNLDLDPLVSPFHEENKPACRKVFLQDLLGYEDDETKLKSRVVNFCRQHQSEGPTVHSLNSLVLGHVHSFNKLLAAVCNEDSGLSYSRVKSLVRDIVTDDSSVTKLEKQKIALFDSQLGIFQFWSYPVLDPLNPFEEIGNSRSEVTSVLGLGYYAYTAINEELVRWSFILPKEITVRRPTAWDAADYAYWRPGGKTYRLNSEEFGLLEYVHSPIKGESLTTAIEVIS